MLDVVIQYQFFTAVASFFAAWQIKRGLASLKHSRYNALQSHGAGYNTMKLYTYYRSSAAYRVRIALNLKRIACEYVYLDLKNAAHKTKSFAAINPQQFVPTLLVNGNGMTQSLSIIRYLDTTCPEPGLYGDDAMQTAQIESASQLIACDIHPLNNLRVLQYLKNQTGLQPTEVDDWYRHWITEGFKVLEQIVQPANTDTPFCFANRVTLADVCLAPQMYNARRFAVNLSPYPRLVAIDAHLMSLAEFSDAAPENQPDCAS